MPQPHPQPPRPRPRPPADATPTPARADAAVTDPAGDAAATDPAGTEPPTPPAARALDDVLVADFSRVLAGPLAAATLADLGAEVIKVERPGTGDDTRAWGPPFAADRTAAYFDAANRSKRGMTLDLGDPDDAAAARELARRADVLIENFRPGSLALPQGPDKLRPGGGPPSAWTTPPPSPPTPAWCTARSPASAPARAPGCPATTSSYRPSEG
ncbi:CoA transferase [Streptomyces tubercidicus]|uniref:CoA transferase n=1 Tax=Streptomyces tubercidicus TaxID=47759 RepID=A0A640UV67_9ACTN|nr:hypothetical protein Stube_39370 [Streptomyces tubercidicus]